MVGIITENKNIYHTYHFEFIVNFIDDEKKGHMMIMIMTMKLIFFKCKFSEKVGSADTIRH